MTRHTVGSEGSKSWRAARSRSASSSLESADSPATRPFGAGVEPTLGFEPRTCCLGIGKITPSRSLDPAPEVVVEQTLAVLKLGQLSESDLVREIADACDDY